MSSTTHSSPSRRRRSGNLSSQQQQQQQPLPPSERSSRQGVHHSPAGSLRNGYPNIERQNTHRFDNRTTASTTKPQHHTNTPNHNNTNEHQDVPLHDRIVASAVAASLEFLRIAGGVTLSTTGTLMQPPLHVTQKYVLPQLWHALVDLLKKDTPDRLQDWFRIVSSSVYHFVSVLRETVSGQALRERLIIVLADLVQVLATDTSRQALIDFTACWVKFAAWCDSTECHDYLDQLCVYWIRVLQVLSSGKTQQLILDSKTVVQSLAQVLNDPQTTIAWAEVTAYLCYALEMEQTKFATISKNVHQRHDRDVYQQELHNARVSLQSRMKPDGTPITVEEAILSSMGKLRDDLPTQIFCNDDDGEDNEHSDYDSNTQDHQQASIDWDQESSIRQQLDESMEGMPEKVQKDVNVDFLRERILHAAPAEYTTTAAALLDMPEKLISETANDDAASKSLIDIEELPLESNGPSEPRRTRAHLESETDGPLASEPWRSDVVEPQEGETTVQHFYRVLDAILEEKRTTTNFASKPKGRVLRQNQTSVMETLKQRLLANSLSETERPSSTLKVGSRHLKWILLGLVLLALLWFVLGCYGFYVLILQPAHTSSVIPSKSPPNEIVIRIVRDRSDSSLSTEDQQRLAQCVGNTFT